MRWSLALLVFVAVMAGAGYYVYSEALRGGSYVQVPDVTMRPVTEASFLLAEKGLELGAQTKVVDERIPKHYVITQRPAAGKVVRTGRKVFLTVSGGNESLTPPNLVGKMLTAAQEELKTSAFVLGTVPRIPHASPRDTILAQDPAPSSVASSGARINLLVSDGSRRAAFIMPDLVGKPVQEVLQLLVPRGVMPVPNKVDMPGQRMDVVLDQQPPAGTLIQEGDRVIYSVYPSGSVTLPDARKTVRVSYTVPNSWFEREVRVDTVDRHGLRSTVFPLETDYVDDEPPRFGSGTQITLRPLSYIDSMTVEIYLDGQLAESRVYKGDGEPEIKQFTVQ